MNRAPEPAPVVPPSDPAIAEAKRRARAEVDRLVGSLTRDERRRRSARACEHLVASEAFARAGAVLFYIATRDELDLAPAIAAALAGGKTVCAPRTDWASRRMEPAVFSRLEVGVPGGLVERRFGLFEPGPEGRALPSGELDLVLVPGVAFDPSGRRLGRGAGFYDRFLSPERGPPAEALVGVGFACQVLGRVPAEAHDRPVGRILTEDGLVSCKS